MAGVSLHGRNVDKSWLFHDLRKHVHSMGYGHLRWHGFSLEGINRNRFRLMNTTMRYQSKLLWGLSGTRELTIGDLGIATGVWLHCQTDREDEPEQTARFCLQSIVLAILINNNISAVCRLVSYVNPRPSFTLDDVSLCLYYDNILQSKTHKAFARSKQHLVEEGNNDNDLTIPVYGFSCLSYTNWWSHGLSSRQSAIKQWHSRTLYCDCHGQLCFEKRDWCCGSGDGPHIAWYKYCIERLAAERVYKMEHERSKGHKARTDIRWTSHHSQGEPQVLAWS